MGDIFIISDTHFGHRNIIEYCNRPFIDVVKMDNAIIENWNKAVTPEDIVYHLGDFWFGNKETFNGYMDRLNGKIHLIKGNHDKLKNIDVSRLESFSDYQLLEYKGKRILLIHYPIHHMEYKVKRPQGIQYDLCLFGHVHNHIDIVNDKKHWNVSLEVMGYRPVKLDVILGV